jgi:hypothetical protein
MARQIRDLRKLEFQVAEKTVARVLVELHNAGLFEAGMILVGTLCYMAWLNELGAKAVTTRTQDTDLARRQSLKLATPLPFLSAVAATKLTFSPIPGMAGRSPSRSLKRTGAQELRIDVLTDGPGLGRTVSLRNCSGTRRPCRSTTIC